MYGYKYHPGIDIFDTYVKHNNIDCNGFSRVLYSDCCSCVYFFHINVLTITMKPEDNPGYNKCLNLDNNKHTVVLRLLGTSC